MMDNRHDVGGNSYMNGHIYSGPLMKCDQKNTVTLKAAAECHPTERQGS